MSITQTISGFSGAPQRSDPSTFANKADTFLSELEGLPDELNTWRSQANSLASTVNSDAASASNSAAIAADTVNTFKGAWSSGTTYGAGDSVKYDDVFWLSLVANNQGNTPSEGSYWTLAPVCPQLSVGRINNPLLHLPLKNSLDMICGAGSVTFTRDSTATYVDRYGVVKTAAIDEARFEKEGLLIEGSSENKLTYSEDFTNWALVTGGVTSNVVNSPDGNTTADVLKYTNSDQPEIAQYVAIDSGTFCFSVFCKRKDLDIIKLKSWSSNSGESFKLFFDFSSEYLTLSNGNDSGFEKLSNGWYRIWGTTTLSEDTYFYIRTYSNSGNVDDGTYIWGAQLEKLPFASSYIPTTDAPVTRANERCYIQRNGNVPSLKYGESTVLCDVNLIAKSGSQMVFRDAWAWLYALILDDYNTVFSIISDDQLFVYNVPIESDINYRFGSVNSSETLEQKIYLDGDLIGERTSTPSNDIVSLTIDIGSAGGTNYHLFGHISNFRIYDVALTEAEMRIA